MRQEVAAVDVERDLRCGCADARCDPGLCIDLIKRRVGARVEGVDAPVCGKVIVRGFKDDLLTDRVIGLKAKLNTAQRVPASLLSM